MSTSPRRILATVTLTFLMSAGLAPAETPESPDASKAISAAEIETLRNAVAEEIVGLEAQGGASKPGTLIELLQQLDRTYQEHAALLERVAKEPQTTSEVAESAGPPYPLGVIDATADARDAARSRATRAREALTAARARLDAVRARQERAEKARRLVKDEVESGQRAAQALQVAELESRLAAAEVALRRAEVAHLQKQEATTTAEVTHLEAELESQREAASKDRNDLVDILAMVDKQIFDLDRAAASERFALEEAERRLARVQQSVERSPDDAGRAELEAARFALTAQQRIALLRAEERARLEASKELWQRRHRLLAGESTGEERTRWWKEARESLEELERQARLKNARLAELEDETRTLVGPTTSEGKATAARLASLENLIDAYREELDALERHRRLESRLVAEIETKEERFQMADRVTQLRQAVRDLWTYELWASEDRPITLGKLVSALLALGIGLAIASAGAAQLRSRVFPRLGYDQGAAHAFGSLAFYGLVIVVFLTALRIVNIPLTAFAVVGGALAIGVGFGSQNIVNNFISGVILLAERPIKLGDLLQVGEIYGQVERIGLRSTRVRTGDNVHVILPNSSILESQVTNWSHNDPKVRVKLTVGVVYGSPTREVERLIRKALAEHPRVLKDIQPEILFTEFGDNALTFEARFWIIMRRLMDRLKIESDLRFAIDDLFREADIVIAFPQRDVHLDSVTPIQIEMVAAAAKDGEAQS